MLIKNLRYQGADCKQNQCGAEVKGGANVEWNPEWESQGFDFTTHNKTVFLTWNV